MDVTPQKTGGEKAPVPVRSDKRFFVLGGIGIMLALGLVILAVTTTGPMRIPQRAGEETYTLVRDKISKSAAIALALPKGVKMTPVEAKQKVTFEPILKGRWAAGRVPTELFFEPSSKLQEGTYYTVSLETPDGTLSKDFFVDEDPKVLSIFPREKSEAPENSEITIVFNRPMVPLTTLDALDERDIPVEITPATKGKFKWISTRNLQFIPETHLVRSATYTVRLKDGLTSVDGLPVKGVTHTFSTRPLRYADTWDGPNANNAPVPVPYPPTTPYGVPVPAPSAGKGSLPSTIVSEPVLYHQPFSVAFNQPVDLERTKGNITVSTGGKSVPFILEYGTRVLFEEGKQKAYIDKSVLAIYSAADRHRRARFWDFNTQYSVTIRGAVPAEGDIVLQDGRIYSFGVPEVIEKLSATSPRTDYADPDLFDPQGKLWVNFYEDIDKDASSIKAPHLRKIEYGERCKPDSDGNVPYDSKVCEKEADKKQISLTFDSDAFARGEAFQVEFRKIVNMAGVSLLPEPTVRTVKVFPALRITKTVPDSGAAGAKLTELTICSNTPLHKLTEENFSSRIKSLPNFGKWNWSNSYQIGVGNTFTPCAVDEFETTLRYGLIPETRYDISLSLVDDYGQTASKQLSFTSGKIDQMYRRFSHLQKAYNVTSPERTKLVYGVENLEYVNLHICEVDATTMMRYLDPEHSPAPTQSGEALGCTESWGERIELPKRYFTANFFTVDLKDYVSNPLGHYILTFSHPEYRRNVYDYRKGVSATNALAYERSFITVTNLAVQEKKLESTEFLEDRLPPLTSKVQQESKGNLYWVTRFGSLDPVAGARIDVYKENGGWASGGTTGADGIARTPVSMSATAAIVTSGADSAIVSSKTDKFQWAQSLASAQKTYIYTDRPIYRPNEEVSIKGLYRVGYDGEYEIVRSRKANIYIYDSRGEQIMTSEADISENGTFTAKLKLAAGAPLGMYRIEALGGYGYFEVEEYVPAAFKVELGSLKEEYIAGEKLALSVDAAYYFGVPLEAGDSVEYSLLAQDYYFDRYTDGYFQFGKGWYYGGYGGYGDRFLLRDKTTLNEKGKATIEQLLDFEKLFKATDYDEGSGDRSKIITVNVTVKNKQGQTVSSRKSFIVHRGAFYLGSNLEHRYFGKGQENTLFIKSVDTQGKPTAVGGIDATIYKITWESFKRQEVDGRFYYRSERKREAVKTFSMRTNSSGDDKAVFSLDGGGEYELEVKATDKRGNPVVSILDFYVYGEGAVSVRPTNNETLELAVDRNVLNVGDTANVIIKSPFEKGKALVTIERGRIFEYQIVEVNQSLVNIGVPIKEIYLPNVYFSVILLSPRPEVKFGQVEFKISSAEKALSIDVRSERKNYLPGEKVRLFVETKDKSGRGVPSEVSIAVADMSVLALKGNPKKDPVAFFYAGFPLGVSTASNVKNILYEAEVPAGTKGGGGGDEDLARKKRGDFRSTAFWREVVITDASGKASVEFTLPDNLTTWQSEVVGITKDTKVGVGYSELVARKEVMVTPLKPRFIVPGDTFKLGAKVFNQSEETVRFNIKLESATLILPSAKNAFERIGPGESAAVYFDAVAPANLDAGSHRYTISAEGADLLDVVEDSITIKKNDTYESVATSFSTSKERAREFVFLPENVLEDKGALTITANSTLALYISEALSYLIGFPYGCSEQIASKLSSIALIKRAHIAKGTLDSFNSTSVEFDNQTYRPDDLIEIGLSRIYSNQTFEGGFTYYQGTKPNFYLSLHILNTLEDLRRAGYPVRADVIQKAYTYVQNGALYTDAIRKDQDTLIFAAHALERAGQSLGLWNPLRNKVIEIAGNRKFVRETGSNLSLSYLALILSGNGYPESLRNEVLATLENRLTIDGRGAFLKMGDRRIVYDYYETPIKDTALLLRAWVAARKDHELADKVMRWLIKSRSKDGSWGSTNNTLAAVEAFTEYLEWKRESDSNFELSVLFDGVEIHKALFNPSTKDTTETLRIPVVDISKGKMHAVDFVKKNLNALPNTFYYDLLLTYFLPIDAVPARDEGFAVKRDVYALTDAKMEKSLTEAKVGDVLKGVLTITVPKERRFVAVEGFIPAGTELLNFNLDTEDQSLRRGGPAAPSYYGEVRGSAPRFMAAIGIDGKDELPDALYSGALPRRERLHADAEELRDDRLFLFREWLPAGVYEYEYYLRALVPGRFHHLPAVVSELYFPENFGRTRGDYFTVVQQ